MRVVSENFTISYAVGGITGDVNVRHIKTGRFCLISRPKPDHFHTCFAMGLGLVPQSWPGKLLTVKFAKCAWGTVAFMGFEGRIGPMAAKPRQAMMSKDWVCARRAKHRLAVCGFSICRLSIMGGIDPPGLCPGTSTPGTSHYKGRSLRPLFSIPYSL